MQSIKLAANFLSGSVHIVRKKKAQDVLVSYSFIFPFIIFFSVFIILPIIYVIYLSFHEGTFLDPKFTWVGIDNYKAVLTSKDIQNAFINTCIYMAVEMPVCMLISIIYGLLMKKRTKLSHVCEIVYFLPMLISMVVASVLIAYILSINGPVSLLAKALHLPVINWLNGSFSAKMAVMILEFWKGGTFFIFVFMSAFRNVSEDCLEAARIDGADMVQTTFYVTLPLIRNIIILCVSMDTIWQFQIFESVYMLTNGGPLGATQTVIYEIFQYGFRYYKVGFGSAASILFLFIILIIYGIENVLLKEKEPKRRHIHE